MRVSSLARGRTRKHSSLLSQPRVSDGAQIELLHKGVTLLSSKLKGAQSSVFFVVETQTDKAMVLKLVS